MAATILTAKGSNRTRRTNRYNFNYAPGAVAYTTGGQVVDLTLAVISPGATAPFPDYFPTVTQVSFTDTCAGYTAKWVVGTTLKNGKIKFFSAAGTELAASTFPAAMQADSVDFVVEKTRGASN